MNTPSPSTDVPVRGVSKDSLIFVTGGHTTPAVACIAELRRRGFNRIIYIGQKKSVLFDRNDSAEYRLVAQELRLPFKSLITGKFSLFANFECLLWLLRFPVGFLQSLWWQATLTPHLVLTFGSHLGIPVAFWAWAFGIPVVAHEQTVTLGRAQRLIQHFARRICFSWPKPAGSYDETRFTLTGNPIRKELLRPTGKPFPFADPKRPMLFVTGGNQGAHAINELVLGKLTELTAHYNVLHQTGSNSVLNDFGKARKAAEALNAKGVVYIPKDYIFPGEMANGYAQATVLLSRAGANTITELLALKKRALLIPIPTTAGNEQFLNAELLAELGLGRVVRQSDAEKCDLLAELKTAEQLAIKDEARLNELSSLHNKAEERIVAAIEQVLSSH
jgi:UDP-N-acetylglucosamine--N-acetylmuramyl-(pentapeptide) pyrophosphoryl-undecaprenol N-acetylglucosamine transferase